MKLKCVGGKSSWSERSSFRGTRWGGERRVQHVTREHSDTSFWFPSWPLVSFRGTSDTSRHSWSEDGRGRPGLSERGVTCGDPPPPTHTQPTCSERSAQTSRSSLPKVTRFHGTTNSSELLITQRRGLRFLLGLFTATNRIISLNYGVLTLPLLHGLKKKHRPRWRRRFFVLPSRKGGASSLQRLSSWHLSTFASNPSRHLYNLFFLLLKFVRLFLMEYILKMPTDKRFTFLNICKILTCVVDFVLFLFGRG